jgi:hypothetical protein
MVLVAQVVHITMQQPLWAEQTLEMVGPKMEAQQRHLQIAVVAVVAVEMEIPKITLSDLQVLPVL